MTPAAGGRAQGCARSPTPSPPPTPWLPSRRRRARGTARWRLPSYWLAAEALAALRTTLRYRTETIDSDDRKLIRHLRRNGRITNADVRDHLDCDTYTARNRLTRLRSKGWIDFADDSPRRGPDVVYVKLGKLEKLYEDVDDSG